MSTLVIKVWLFVLMLFALGFTAPAAFAQTPTGKRIALVVGNDAYQHVGKLKKAGNDATAMARELKAAGFEVLLHRDLNYRGMVKAVETLANSITGGDQVVVFFAGHGVQIKSGSYLLPIDIDVGSESEVEKTAYGLDDLTEKLKQARASFTLVMVDACRDNPLKSNGRSVGAARGLNPPDPPKGQMIVYSASKGQQALDQLGEKDANPNGVFTREFISRMRRPGVRIEDLVREVQDSVEALARTISHDQRPAIYNEARGNFYFFGPTTVQVAPHTAAPARMTPTAPPGQAGTTGLEDLEKEESIRKEWANWQSRMKIDFDKAAAFQGSVDLQARAWERFLASWSQDNPLSRDDDVLRAQAQARREQALRQAVAAAQLTRPEPLMTSQPMASGVQTVKIGHVAPMSGGQAHYGRDNANGALMAVEDLNAQNIVIGGKKIVFELQAEDDASDPRRGVAVAQKLCDSKVAGVVGHLNSGTTIPASRVYSDCGIPHITGAATNPNLTRPGYKTTYRIIANDNALGPSLAAYASDTLRLKRVAIIDDRTAYGQGVADTFKRTALANGMEVVAQEYTTDRATDFMGILSAIRSKSPDAIFYGGMDSQAGPMLRQMGLLNMNNIAFFGGDGICTAELAKLAAGARTLDKVICAEGGAAIQRMPDGPAWKARYDAKYPGQFQVYSPYTYDATFVLVDAMKRANSVDPRVYTPMLPQTSFRGITDNITFEQNGEIRNPAVTLSTYRNARKVVLN